MSTDFLGRTVLVTGSTSDIGRAIAIAFAMRGAQVIAHGRNATRGAAVVEELIEHDANPRFIAADLSDPAHTFNDSRQRQARSTSWSTTLPSTSSEHCSKPGPRDSTDTWRRTPGRRYCWSERSRQE